MTAIAVFMIMAAMIRPQIAKADSTMDQLERTYAGTTVVDGAYDNDTILNAMNLAIQGYEEQLVIYRPKEDVLRSDYYKFHVNSDFAYFWVDGWSWKMHEDYAVVTFRYCGDAATIDRMQKEVYEVLDGIYYTVKDWDSEWRVAQYGAFCGRRTVSCVMTMKGGKLSGCMPGRQSTAVFDRSC